MIVSRVRRDRFAEVIAAWRDYRGSLHHSPTCDMGDDCTCGVERLAAALDVVTWPREASR